MEEEFCRIFLWPSISEGKVRNLQKYPLSLFYYHLKLSWFFFGMMSSKKSNNNFCACFILFPLRWLPFAIFIISRPFFLIIDYNLCICSMNSSKTPFTSFDRPIDRCYMCTFTEITQIKPAVAFILHHKFISMIDKWNTPLYMSASELKQA